MNFENNKQPDLNLESSAEGALVSESLFLKLQKELENFSKPNMQIIYLAQKYIHALKHEGKDFGKNKERGEAFSKKIKRKLIKKFGGCVGCGRGTSGGPSRHDLVLQPHHIKPREFGGETSIENAMLVCRDCHVLIHS